MNPSVNPPSAVPGWQSPPTSSNTEFQRDDYREFRYEGYDIAAGSATLTSTFSLIGDQAQHSFTETVTLPAPIRDRAVAEPIMRLLALATGLSYYKSAAPGRISVAFGLTDIEREFLTSLIGSGLGEFAYRNDLVEALTPVIDADRVSHTPAPAAVNLEAAPLVAVGGGKDSVVSIEACRHLDNPPVLFSVNRYAAIDRCVAVSGCRYVSATRRIDPALFALNKSGALNGHVPVTAINSLAAILTSHALDLGPTVLSNEASANFGNLTWHGRTINHQWSKSLEFENLLRRSLTAANQGPAPYFSLLRPLSELEIARRFSRFPQYFPAFTSCNRVFTLDQTKRRTHWCCSCPKCLFVFLILAPWIPRAELMEIFGTNILDNPAMETAYAEILGLTGHKPFECVGEPSEARAAWRMIAADPDWRQSICVAHLASRVAALPAEDPLADPGFAGNIPAAYMAALDHTA